MRNSENPNKAQWVRRYRTRQASMYRFNSWNRFQQLTYIDLRKSQLEEIKTRLESGSLSKNHKHSNAILYTALNRELKVKCLRFNALDRMFYEERVWMNVGHKHRHQTTLDKWVLIPYTGTPKD